MGVSNGCVSDNDWCPYSGDWFISHTDWLMHVEVIKSYGDMQIYFMQYLKPIFKALNDIKLFGTISKCSRILAVIATRQSLISAIVHTKNVLLQSEKIFLSKLHHSMKWFLKRQNYTVLDLCKVNKPFFVHSFIANLAICPSNTDSHDVLDFLVCFCRNIISTVTAEKNEKKGT